MNRFAVASLILLFATLANDVADARSAVSTAAPRKKFHSASNPRVTAPSTGRTHQKLAASDWTAGWGDVGAR